MNKELFSKNLKAWMEFRDINQAELAEKIGATQTSISYWCNALKVPRMDKIDKLCIALGCNYSDLISENGRITECTVTLSAEEYALINSYRNAPDSQKQAIRLLLGVEV